MTHPNALAKYRYDNTDYTLIHQPKLHRYEIHAYDLKLNKGNVHPVYTYEESGLFQLQHPRFNWHHFLVQWVLTLEPLTTKTLASVLDLYAFEITNRHRTGIHMAVEGQLAYVRPLLNTFGANHPTLEVWASQTSTHQFKVILSASETLDTFIPKPEMLTVLSLAREVGGSGVIPSMQELSLSANALLSETPGQLIQWMYPPASEYHSFSSPLSLKYQTRPKPRGLNEDCLRLFALLSQGVPLERIFPLFTVF